MTPFEMLGLWLVTHRRWYFETLSPGALRGSVVTVQLAYVDTDDKDAPDGRVAGADYFQGAGDDLEDAIDDVLKKGFV